MIRSFGKRDDWLKYQNNSPYPHIVIDNFLNRVDFHNISKEAYTLCSKPSESWRFGGRGNSKDEHTFQQKKRGIGVQSNMSYNMSRLIDVLNGEEFIKYLENLTGKTGLIPDPNLFGGGLHETKSGGYLGIHHDFNVNNSISKETYYRQINLLLYINAHWEKDWGGSLELWNKDMSGPNQIIDIVPNRCVIFNIDGAPHGHPTPLKSPSDVSRRSIAMYYYSKEEPQFPQLGRAHWEPELKKMV